MKRIAIILLIIAPLSGCALARRAVGDRSLEDFFVDAGGNAAPAAHLIGKALDRAEARDAALAEIISCAAQKGCINKARAAELMLPLLKPAEAATIRRNIEAKQDLIRARRGLPLAGEAGP